LAEGEGSRFFGRAPTRGEAFDILTNDGTDPISGEFSEGDNVVGMFDGHTYGFHIDYDFNADGGAVGNDIRLTAVPEPATWLLMGLGGLIVLGARPLGAQWRGGCVLKRIALGLMRSIVAALDSPS
jgi:hypothetical protein